MENNFRSLCIEQRRFFMICLCTRLTKLIRAVWFAQQFVSRLRVIYIYYYAKRDIIVMASSDANGARNVVANARNIYIHNYTKYTCIRIKSTVHNRITIFYFVIFQENRLFHLMNGLKIFLCKQLIQRPKKWESLDRSAEPCFFLLM